MEETQADQPDPTESDSRPSDHAEPDLGIPEDAILDYVNSQCHSTEDLDSALPAYQAYHAPISPDPTISPERSINHH